MSFLKAGYAGPCGPLVVQQDNIALFPTNCLKPDGANITDCGPSSKPDRTRGGSLVSIFASYSGVSINRRILSSPS